MDGETIAVIAEQEVIGRVPLHNLERIVSCGYSGASPALMGECAKRGIALVFLTKHGQFLAEVTGEFHGNVLLRKEQYRISDQAYRSLPIAKSFLLGKLYNSRAVLLRMMRDHPNRLELEVFQEKTAFLKAALKQVETADSLSELMGWEGKAAVAYFSVFDSMILQQKEYFFFHRRNKRPPLDAVNALMSFAYSLFAKICQSALQAVGLDPYVGFLHQDRPGRASLALDLIEEFRSVFCDRFVLTLVNKKIIKPQHFMQKENGAVFLTEEGRKLFFQSWQEKKKETLQHPFLEESIPWGMVPYAQALLLSRYLRGDLDAYPPFFWK